MYPAVGDLTATVDLRLYLRDKTVRRLNRHRSPEHRLHFRSKFHLAREILEGLKLGCPVCAHFVHYTSRRNRVPPRRGFRVEVQ